MTDKIEKETPKTSNEEKEEDTGLRKRTPKPSDGDEDPTGPLLAKGDSKKTTAAEPAATPKTTATPPVAAMAQKIDVNKSVEFVKQNVQAVSPNRRFLVFVVVFFPCLVLSVGSLLGQLISVCMNSLHVIAGLALAAFFAVAARDEKRRLQGKEELVHLAALSAATIMIADGASSFVSRLIMLVGFCALPFIVRQYFPWTEPHKPSDEAQVQLLELATGGAVVFTVSAGGTGYLNCLALALSYAAALFACDAAFPALQPHLRVLPPQLQTKTDWQKTVIHVLLAHVILTVLTSLMPFLSATQNGFLALVFYLAVGLAALSAPLLLHDMEGQQFEQAKLAVGIAAVVANIYLFVVWAM